MQAMVLESFAPIEEKPLTLQTVPIPEPKEREIRVKVSVCGVCRTELHLIENELPNPKLPIIPGHEVVGVVDKRGEKADRFEEGARVGVAWLRHTCRECMFCKRGQENLCEKSRYTGYHANGGYAEYAVVDERYAYPIPDVFTDQQAAPLLCAGIIGYRAYRRANLPKKARLGIIGFGSSAHVTAQLALYEGHELYVATRSEHHQELARTLGASFAGDSNHPLPEQMDSIILFAPAGALVPLALRSLRRGGTAVCAGIHMSPIPSMLYEECLFHEKNLRSVEANTREDGKEFLALAAKIPIQPKITAFPLKEANEVLEKVKNDGFEGSAVLQIEK